MVFRRRKTIRELALDNNHEPLYRNMEILNGKLKFV
jgi:hypothetical protein